MIGWRSKPQAVEEQKPKGFDDFDLRLGDLMRGERATLGKSLLDVQRDLKIKATYIAAIENADISAFEAPGFVAGYVRSYSRYLGMDPDQTFAHFCREANYTPAHGMSAMAAPARATPSRARSEFSDPLANPNLAFIPKGDPWYARIEPGAVGSVAVLALLIGALGYGGWSILREVQRVQLSPVEQAPTVVVSIDPLSPGAGLPGAPVAVAPMQSGNGTSFAAADADLMDRLYRPQALDVPVMVSRNGPIGAIDPRTGQTATAQSMLASADQPYGPMLPTNAQSGDSTTGQDIQVTANVRPGIEVLAVRPSWVRVTSADGTVLFEKILDTGERYSVPRMEQAATFRAGNSGAVYFVVDGTTYGPAAPGANVVKNIKLSSEALVAAFGQADLGKDADLQRIMTAEAASSL